PDQVPVDRTRRKRRRGSRAGCPFCVPLRIGSSGDSTFDLSPLEAMRRSLGRGAFLRWIFILRTRTPPWGLPTLTGEGAGEGSRWAVAPHKGGARVDVRKD